MRINDSLVKKNGSFLEKKLFNYTQVRSIMLNKCSPFRRLIHPPLRFFNVKWQMFLCRVEYKTVTSLALSLYCKWPTVCY